MFTIQKASQVTYIDYEFTQEKQILTILMGDETGYVRVLDVSFIIKSFELKPIIPKEENRNMMRKEEYTFSEDNIIDRSIMDKPPKL